MELHWKTDNVIESDQEPDTLSKLTIEPAVTIVQTDVEAEWPSKVKTLSNNEMDSDNDDGHIDYDELYEKVYVDNEIEVECKQNKGTRESNDDYENQEENNEINYVEHTSTYHEPEVFNGNSIETQHDEKPPPTKRSNRRTKNKLGDPPFECETCGHMCSSRELLSSHRHRKHRLIENVFPCPKCKKTFNTRKRLQQHEKRPTCATYPEFLCEYCNKKCIGLSNFNIHLRFHKKQYPFVCHICAKGFMMATHLTTHIKSKHENQRFFCEKPSCGKSFQTMHSLKIHAYTHLETMPYKCEYCDRNYPTKGRLCWHIKKSHGIHHTLDELDRMLVAEKITLKAEWKPLYTEVVEES